MSVHSRLQEVFELRKLGVRIAVIHQGVEKLDGLPDPHALVVKTEIFIFLRPDESKGLAGVVEPVELLDRRTRLGTVIAEEFPGALETIGRHGPFFRITGDKKIFPFIEAAQRPPAGLSANVFPLFDTCHQSSPPGTPTLNRAPFWQSPFEESTPFPFPGMFSSGQCG